MHGDVEVFATYSGAGIGGRAEDLVKRCAVSCHGIFDGRISRRHYAHC